MARERLVKVVNQAGRGQEEGEEQEGQLALILMVLVGGRASVRNAAETFGLDYANLGGVGRTRRRVEGLEVLSDR